MGRRRLFGCAIILRNYDVGNWPFSSYHHWLVIFFVCLFKRARNWWWKEKKAGIPLNSIFILAVPYMGYLFSRTSRNKRASGQGVRWVSGIIFSKLWIWRSTMCVCAQSVCSADASISRKHNVLLRPLCPSWQPREKGLAPSVEVCQGNWERVSFCRQEAHFFRHAQIAVPVRGPLENCYFCI